MCIANPSELKANPLDYSIMNTQQCISKSFASNRNNWNNSPAS